MARKPATPKHVPATEPVIVVNGDTLPAASEEAQIVMADAGFDVMLALGPEQIAEALAQEIAPLMPIPDGLSLTTDLWNRCVSYFGVEEATRLARAFAPAAVEEILP